MPALLADNAFVAEGHMGWPIRSILILLLRAELYLVCLHVSPLQY